MNKDSKIILSTERLYLREMNIDVDKCIKYDRLNIRNKGVSS